MKPNELRPYRAALRERICAFCAESDGRGGCSGADPDRCALTTHIDEVIESVLSVGERPDVAPYLAAIRARVCTRCREDESGACFLRDAGQCNLDAYLVPVIEVIEDVAKGAGAQSCCGGGGTASPER